ncbi:hypothetical protein HGRIS_011428 [Hohenbuehelia grisea]|uniref:Uncharacterized protein n=1 Tax=Hohenbuehelia grisea TaxID=104357 RepID=A0ABR3JW11_9AGAR
MLASFATKLATVAALVAGVVSTPIAYTGSADLAVRSPSELSSRTFHSFNLWNGHRSLDHFDNFYGEDNFDGRVHFNQVVESENRLVCHAQAIEIIQQRLVVLQEMAKRIITETICEVETQTVVFQQFHASFGHFGSDLRRKSGHRVGYDSRIVSHFGEIINEEDSSISTHDFGFSGSDVGSHTVIVGGHNWDDRFSPFSVESAWGASNDAILSLQD